MLAFCAMSIHRFFIPVRWPLLAIALLTLTIASGAQQNSAPKQSTPVKPSATAPVSTEPKPASPQPAGPMAPATPPDPGANLSSDTPVITLNNVCAPGTTGDCKTVITKGEFEKLMAAATAKASLTQAERKQIVQPFAQVVVLNATAEKQGLDKQPDVETMLKVARMSTLSKALIQRQIKEAQQVTPEQMDEYYKQHQNEYEEAKIERLLIPKIASGQNIDQAKAKALAERLQKQAATAKGLDELEKQAYTELGLKQQPPPVDMGVHRRNQLPPAHQEAVFALSPGQITDVLEDPNAFYVYRVDTKTTVPEANLTNEIKNAIAQKKYGDHMRSIFNSVDATLNPDYFEGMKTIDWEAGSPGERERPTPTRATPSRTPSTLPPAAHP